MIIWAMLSEGIVTPDTKMECQSGITDGNIKVGCHKHRSPLNLKDALAQSCNTWFIVNFGSMINDDFMYESKREAITTWRSYMQSMGLGGPMHIDIPGEQGGLLAGLVIEAYLKGKLSAASEEKAKRIEKMKY